MSGTLLGKACVKAPMQAAAIIMVFRKKSRANFIHFLHRFFPRFVSHFAASLLRIADETIATGAKGGQQKPSVGSAANMHAAGMNSHMGFKTENVSSIGTSLPRVHHHIMATRVEKEKIPPETLSTRTSILSTRRLTFDMYLFVVIFVLCCGMLLCLRNAGLWLFKNLWMSLIVLLMAWFVKAIIEQIANQKLKADAEKALSNKKL